MDHGNPFFLRIDRVHLLHGFSVKYQLSLRRFVAAGQNIHQRGLPRTVFTYDCHNLPPAYLKVYIM